MGDPRGGRAARTGEERTTLAARRKALERNAAMAVAGEIASGRVAVGADGYLPLEELVAAHAPATSPRRVIALLQGWQWVRRVAPDRWVAGDGAADPHRDDRAAFPRDGRCAACTQPLAGAYTAAAGGRLVLCAPCAEPVRSGVALDDVGAVVAALLGARSADKAARLANRLRERFPDLSWAEVRRLAHSDESGLSRRSCDRSRGGSSCGTRNQAAASTRVFSRSRFARP